MMWQYIALALIGLGAGTIISAGVFALIAATGMVTRLAAKTHTGSHVRIYEDAIMSGGIIFNVIWVFEITFGIPRPFNSWIEVFVGIIQGIFVGCLAVSLAEALNATSVFARRVKLRMGVSAIVFFVAISKIIGGLVQFSNNWAK